MNKTSFTKREVLIYNLAKAKGDSNEALAIIVLAVFAAGLYTGFFIYNIDMKNFYYILQAIASAAAFRWFFSSTRKKNIEAALIDLDILEKNG